MLQRYSGGIGQRATTAFGDTRSFITYLPGDGETDAALIIDPIPQTAGRDLQRLGELWLELRYVLETPPDMSTTSPMPAAAR